MYKNFSPSKDRNFTKVNTGRRLSAILFLYLRKLSNPIFYLSFMLKKVKIGRTDDKRNHH